MDKDEIQLSGEEHFQHDRQLLYDRLTDLTFMAQTVPGLQKIEHVDDTSLRCRVRPGFSFLAGSMKLDFEILDKQPPESAHMRVKGKGIGSTVVVESTMQLVPAGDGTTLKWHSAVKELSGLSKVISRGLVEAAARKVNAQTWESFRQKLGEA